MKDLFASKKFKTALVGVIVPFVVHFLGLPLEIAEQAIMGIVAAIGGFAVQDYAKARDAPKVA